MVLFEYVKGDELVEIFRRLITHIPIIDLGTPVYTPTRFSMVKTNDHYEVDSTITNCREVLTLHLIKTIQADDFIPESLSKIRVIFFNTRMNLNKARKVLILLNSVEDIAKIDRTVIRKVKTVQKSGKSYLLEGNVEWLRSTVLISMWLLILKYSWRNLQEKGIVPTYEEVKENPKEYFDKVSYEYESYDHWLRILFNRDDLFPSASDLTECYKFSNIYDMPVKKKPDPHLKVNLMSCYGLSKFINKVSRLNLTDVYYYHHFKSYKKYHNNILKRSYIKNESCLV